MNGKDLLIGLGSISPKYYDEAENDTITEVKRHRTFRRPLLVAAIIALLLMLVGCAVVYVLRLQDMSIGTETYTQTFDDNGRYLEEPVEKTRAVLTLFGHSGDNIQKATAEWFAFLETYDPDGALLDNNPAHVEIPNQYEYTYDCYTPEMVAKVDEIAAKYNLKLLEEWLPFQAYQSDIFLEESGIHSLVRPDCGAEMTRLSGMFYPPYNFDVDIELSADSLENNLWITVLYARKDYFPNDYPGGTDLSLFEQWDYTAPDGTALLMALSNKGYGYVIAELDNAMMILAVDGNYSRSAYPTEEEIMTREELEAAASFFDYSIQPQIKDRAAVAKKLEESNTARETENVYVPETYGSFVEALKAGYTLPNKLAQYAFYDLTGDGQEELLTSSLGNGAITGWYTIQNGEIHEDFGISYYLCEGRVLEVYYPDPELDRGQHDYFHAYSETEWTRNTSEGRFGEWITTLCHADGDWVKYLDSWGLEQASISADEAQAIMAQYPRIELEWKPVMEYPISEDQTLGEYIEAKDVRVSQDELLQIYKDKLNGMKDMYYSHYRILDINGDGVDDLLLKGKNDALIGNTDFYWMARTYGYGRTVNFASDFYLCEDGVLEHAETRHTGGIGVEIDGHEFMRYTGLEKEVLDFVAYNKATASWQTDWWDEEPISEEEANTILAKYPRIDQGMRPISELLN